MSQRTGEPEVLRRGLDALVPYLSQSTFDLSNLFSCDPEREVALVTSGPSVGGIAVHILRKCTRIYFIKLTSI